MDPVIGRMLLLGAAPADHRVLTTAGPSLLQVQKAKIPLDLLQEQMTTRAVVLAVTAAG
jgi:hypothetical protein